MGKKCSINVSKTRGHKASETAHEIYQFRSSHSGSLFLFRASFLSEEPFYIVDTSTLILLQYLL